MTQRRIYMDFNATAPLRPQALAAMVDALRGGGNASSIHAEGRAARASVEQARSDVAALVNGAARNVIFTSGGTEALNLALTPSVSCGGNGAPVERLLVPGTEHACVLHGHRFAADRVTVLPVLPSGVLDLAALEAALSVGGRAMLALQLANNETGVIQPVRAAADRVHRHGGLVVCDAVQAAGKITVDLAELAADMLVVSAHKFGGPKGAGALVLAGADTHISSVVLRGGGQERGARAGTENVAALAGFGAAARAAADTSREASRVLALRGALEADLTSVAADAVIFGEGEARLVNTVAFAVPGLRAETLLIGLDLAGVAVSSGSACSSGKVGRSHVLAAMGIGEPLLGGAVRLSLGWSSTAEDVAGFAAAFARLMKHRVGSRLAA